MLDLQSSGAASTSGSADSTTVANDLQSLFTDLSKAGGERGRRAQSACQGASDGAGATGSGAAGSGQGATNPFQSLAASLLAYTKGQGLATAQTAGSTALTA